jgi:hypothetical protein
MGAPVRGNEKRPTTSGLREGFSPQQSGCVLLHIRMTPLPFLDADLAVAFRGCAVVSSRGAGSSPRHRSRAVPKFKPGRRPSTIAGSLHRDPTLELPVTSDDPGSARFCRNILDSLRASPVGSGSPGGGAGRAHGALGAGHRRLTIRRQRLRNQLGPPAARPTRAPPGRPPVSRRPRPAAPGRRS